MRSKLIFISLGLLINTAFLKAQEYIPFKMTAHNTIIVKAILNHRDSLDLMFQIAMKDASISADGMKKAPTLLFNNEQSVNNKLNIASQELDSVLVFGNELTGEGADGKIGRSLFSDKIFKIDYDSAQFVLYDKLPDLHDYDAIDISPSRDALCIKVLSTVGNEELEHAFVLQSGYSGGLLYDELFSDKFNLKDKLHIQKSSTLKNSRNETLHVMNATLDRLRLGSYLVHNVPASFFVSESKSQQISYLGTDILHRFNWVFDVKKGKAYIQKSKYFDGNGSV